jgi:hypothetical protein
VEKPYRQMNLELEEMKRSYQGLITSIEQQKKLREHDIEGRLRELSAQMDSLRVSANHSLAQKYDIVYQ